MKELSIEQKAKAYDEAIERAKQMFSEKELNYLFPELKESDDEKIINLLKMVVEKWHNVGYADYVMDIPKSDIISWLEKQGERANFRNKIQIGDKVTRNKDGVLVNLSQLERIAKPNESKQVEQTSDNIEPKFKIGDFITNGILVGKIDKVHELGYHAYFGNFYSDIPDVENWHKWTIQDAKDGDIIIDPATQYDKESVFIFERIDKDNVVRCYVTLSNMQTLRISNDICNVCGYADKILYTPASKEQCDLLFQKMKEAGYEWDTENKQLRKIESRQEELTDFEKAVKHIMEEAIECGDTHNFKADADMLLRLTQKHAEWSEEDEDILNTIINHFKVDIECTDKDDTVRWLKSLKDRVQPQYITITDEELAQAKKDAYKNVLDKIEYDSENPTFDDGWSAAIWYLKKRTAQPQTTWKPSEELDEASYQIGIKRVLENPESYGLTKYNWKPSDEQMEALLYEVNAWDEDSINGQNLKSLYQDLKNLREDKL